MLLKLFKTISKDFEMLDLIFKKVEVDHRGGFIGLTSSGVNFINVLLKAFTSADPKCAKKDSQVSSVFLRFCNLCA